MRIISLPIILGALLLPSELFAQDCPLKVTMDSAEAVSNWRSVNDGVMGGLSSGGPRFEGTHMVFAGVINTDGGGFSSIRAQVAPGAFAGMDGVKFRVKSDGRVYKATFRTDARKGWREVSFQAPLPVGSERDWVDVTVPFNDLKPSVFGRPVRGAKFDPSKVQSIGIILADGQDGPFRLQVESMEVCGAPQS
jgi:NADH dehydrogenase [ubiquinone] 1 alpha subcomplex assembly factor 1